MERILEPEYMDTDAEASDYGAMDHSDSNRDALAQLIALGGGRGRVIDLGTGPGDIPILIAQACPQAHIVGVDAAATMLAIARVKIASANLTDRIEFKQAEVKALPYQSKSFDCVFSNTILHHIPEPLLFLREAWRVLAPDGVLMIRDLYRPKTEEDAWALVNKYAKDDSESQRKLFFDSLHAALTLEEARSVVIEAGITDARVEMTSDRHYTITCHRAK
jgi:ubiquinone/menaquinone biosynthesis C-methylase UbiE